MATIDLFLKVDNIPGESTDIKHKDDIVLESFSWGESVALPASGGGGGKVSMTDFHFAARISKATPKLMLACASGTHIPNVVMTARKAGREAFEFLFYKFKDVIITSVQEAGDGAVPLDQVSFAFSKITVEYREQKASGGVGGITTFGWDLKANKAL
jgi:type VI secretion system secreted protein Hcp